MEKKVENIIEKYSARIDDPRIFFCPDIPANKLKKAIKSYAKGVQEHEVLLLMDDTVLLSFKSGMILTEKALYAKGGNYTATKIDLSKLKSVTLRRNQKHNYNTDYMVINNMKMELEYVNSNSLLSFVEMINEIVSELYGSKYNKEGKSTKSEQTELVITDAQKLKSNKIHTLVLTNQRILFVQQGKQLFEKVKQETENKCKKEGKGYFKRWLDRNEAVADLGDRFYQLKPDDILNEVEGNFQVINSDIQKVQLSIISEIESIRDYILLGSKSRHPYVKITIKARKAEYAYLIDDEDLAYWAYQLKNVLGEKVKL